MEPLLDGSHARSGYNRPDVGGLLGRLAIVSSKSAGISSVVGERKGLNSVPSGHDRDLVEPRALEKDLPCGGARRARPFGTSY